MLRLTDLGLVVEDLFVTAWSIDRHLVRSGFEIQSWRDSISCPRSMLPAKDLIDEKRKRSILNRQREESLAYN
jgi:hypothetical protein